MLSASGCCCPGRLHNHLMNRCFLPVFGRRFFSSSSLRVRKINETLSAQCQPQCSLASSCMPCLDCFCASIAFLHPMKNTTIILNRDKKKTKKNKEIFERGLFPCARVCEFWTRCTFANGHKNGQNDMPGVGWMPRKIKNRTQPNQHDKFNGKSTSCDAKDRDGAALERRALGTHCGTQKMSSRDSHLCQTLIMQFMAIKWSTRRSRVFCHYFFFSVVSLVDYALSDESSIEAVCWFYTVATILYRRRDGWALAAAKILMNENARNIASSKIVVFKIAEEDVVKIWYRNLRALNKRRCTSSHSDVHFDDRFYFFIRERKTSSHFCSSEFAGAGFCRSQ